MSEEEVTRARAGLLRCCEPPAEAVAAFVETTGPVDAWSAIAGRRVPAAVRAATGARLQECGRSELEATIDADLDRAAAAGARLIGPEDADWPAGCLQGLETVAVRGSGGAQPLALYVRGGGVPVAPDGAVTIVGSRAATPYGLRTAAEIAGGMARSGYTVVSGGAYGIDTAAHRAALHVAEGSAPGPLAGAAVTVAVLACGIDRAYPVANAALLDAAAARGAVLSEYPPGTTPARHRFLVRNRIIAALGAGTVVVEAGWRSGSLNTAATADALSRVIMAVPGPVTSALSAGCHDMIRNKHATLVTSPADVLAALGPLGADEPAPPIGHRPTDDLDPRTARVYESLPRRGFRTVIELAISSGIPGVEVLSALAMLDLHSLAERSGPRWRRTG